MNACSYWAITIDNILIGNKDTGACQSVRAQFVAGVRGGTVHTSGTPWSPQCIGVVDTGTSIITGPPAQMDPIVARLNVNENCSNVKSLPPIDFVISGKNFTLTATQYVIKLQVRTRLRPLAAGARGQGVACAHRVHCVRPRWRHRTP